ncbi:MAG TPA: SHOCT domain-containing protein [Nitrospira sp.]|nr:SHOCT domain-containing protein [Nitrospira sp.]
MHEPMIGLWGLVGYVLMIAFFAVGIVAVVLWVKSWLEQGRPGTPSQELESALEILKKHYIRGEISKEEFEEKRKNLL